MLLRGARSALVMLVVEADVGDEEPEFVSYVDISRTTNSQEI